MTIIFPTPHLDEITLNEWFKSTYTVYQEEEIENLLEQHIWVTAKKRQLYVKEMQTSHIKNCINCWEGNGYSKIPLGYLGGKEKWLKIFNQELLNRQ